MCTCKQQQVKIKFYMKQWRSQSTKKNYCYIVHPKWGSHEDFLWFKYLLMQFTSMQQKVLHEPMKIFAGNRNKILQWNNYKIMKKQRKNHTWRTRIFNGTTLRIILQELPFASKLSYVSRINEYQGVIIRIGCF